MTKPIYVTGHKNPDCDSIVSSLAYAYFKQQLGVNAEAFALGSANSETRFLLDKYGWEHPAMITSAKCRLREIEIDEAAYANRSMTMKEALDVSLQRKNKGVFVVDEEGKLEGVVSISDLTSLWTVNEEDLTRLMQKVELRNIVKTLKGNIYNEIADFRTNGVIHLLPGISSDVSERSIVIVGNTPEAQRSAVDGGAALIIISGEDWIDSVTLGKAIEKSVCVMHTDLSVLACSQLIFQSPSIDQIMSTNLVVFNQDETVEEVSARMATTRHRTYPVVDDDMHVVGAVSRYHLFNYEKKRFILVDHNEASQSVNDLEYGEIVEIVDHHRLGGIETTNPINVIARTVGSTSSIVASQFFTMGIEMPQKVAGILLGGLLSDTMNLKSPTTTEEDKVIAGRLSGIANISCDELSAQMIDASDSILKKSWVDLMYDDLKEFRIGEYKVAIGQSHCKQASEFAQVKDEFYKYMQEVEKTQHYDLILILFTYADGRGSHFLYTGNKSWVIEESFADVLKDGFAKGIISRKKQVLPLVVSALKK